VPVEEPSTASKEDIPSPRLSQAPKTAANEFVVIGARGPAAMS